MQTVIGNYRALSVAGGLCFAALSLGALLTLGAPIGASPATAAEDNSGIVVEVESVRNAQGNLVVAVYGDQKSLETYDNPLAWAQLKAKPGKMTHTFSELTKGPYAVAIFHDENEDGRLNMEGELPLEGYGTSGARDAYHVPSFKEASVHPGKVAVRLHYLR